jgi:hypothetical protein
MSYNRRDILKSAGAACAVSVVGLGTVTAQESGTQNECTENVDSAAFDEFCLEANGQTTPACSPPAPIVSQGVAFGEGNPGYVSDVYQIEAGAFEGTEFEGRLIKATAEATPVGGNFHSMIQQRTDGGWSTVSAVTQPEMPHEHEVGEVFATIEPEAEFRFKVQAINIPFTGASAELKVQTFDRDC